MKAAARRVGTGLIAGWFLALGSAGALEVDRVPRQAAPEAVERRDSQLQSNPDERPWLRERRNGRADGGGPPSAERREAMRQRWQEMTPAEREQHVERRRQFRQLSPEERQQLRRDILEANRFGGRDR